MKIPNKYIKITQRSIGRTKIYEASINLFTYTKLDECRIIATTFGDSEEDAILKINKQVQNLIEVLSGKRNK